MNEVCNLGLQSATCLFASNTCCRNVLEGFGGTRYRQRDSEESLRVNATCDGPVSDPLTAKPEGGAEEKEKGKGGRKRIKRSYRMGGSARSHSAEAGHGNTGRRIEIVYIGQYPEAAVDPAIEGGKIGAAGGKEGC